jgi:transposase
MDRHAGTSPTVTPQPSTTRSAKRLNVCADKGYQGCDVITPRKTPPGGELSKGDKANNTVISRLRVPVERLIAHFKSWRILHTDYRRPYDTYRDAYDATRGLFFFSITGNFE